MCSRRARRDAASAFWPPSAPPSWPANWFWPAALSRPAPPCSVAIDASDAPLRPASEPPAAGTAGFIAAGLVIKPMPAHACGIVDEVTVAETACGMIVW